MNCPEGGHFQLRDRVAEARFCLATPPCFGDPMLFSKWLAFAWTSKLSPASSYCLDCTNRYQKEMLQEGLCGHPETHFISTKEGDMWGYWPRSKRPRGRPRIHPAPTGGAR